MLGLCISVEVEEPCLSSLIHFTIGNIDKNELHDAPESRDDVNNANNVLINSYKEGR